MIYNIFMYDPQHYDRGSYTFIGRMDSSIPFPIQNIVSVEDTLGYHLAFYSDEDVIDTEAEERERIGGSIFNLDSGSIFNDIPVPIYDLEDFMKTLREFVENFATDFDDEIIEAAFNGNSVNSDTVDETMNVEEVSSDSGDYPKVPFTVRKKDSGYRIEVDKLSPTVSMVNTERAFYEEARGDALDSFVPDRAVRKVTNERMGDLTWEQVPRLVRHFPDSPLKEIFWILRSSRFKNLDFIGSNKQVAKNNLRTYIAWFDNC